MRTITFKPSLLSIPFDGGLVLADGETERLYVYNASAGLIWTSLSDGISIADCAALISESRRMELPVITAHINSMVSEWRRLGLLYGADASDPQTDPGPPPKPGQNTYWQRDYVIGKHHVRIGSNDADVICHVKALFRPYARSNLDIHHTIYALREYQISLTVDGSPRLELDDSAAAIGAIFQAILEFENEKESWLALIHGASVAIGKTGILLSGSTGSGKSTLAAYLATRKYRYLSDDLIALSAPEGRIVPWPVPHSLKAGSWEPLASHYPTLRRAPIEVINGRKIKFIEPIASSWLVSPVVAHLIIFPHYRPMGGIKIEPVKPLEALSRFVNDRIWVPNPLKITNFLRFLERTPAFSFSYSTLDEAEEALQSLLPSQAAT